MRRTKFGLLIVILLGEKLQTLEIFLGASGEKGFISVASAYRISIPNALIVTTSPADISLGGTTATTARREGCRSESRATMGDCRPDLRKDSEFEPWDRSRRFTF